MVDQAATILADHDVLTRLLVIAPPLIAAERPGARLCVLSTRVVTEVLTYFGYNASPWSCRVVAMNAIAARGYAQGLPWPEIFAAGGWTLGQSGTGVVTRAKDFRWDGHLAVIVNDITPNTAVLADACLGDYHHPDRGVITAPLLALVPHPRLEAGKRLPFSLAAGGLLIYEPIPSDVWRSAPDWTTRSRWAPVVSALIRALRTG